MVQNRGGLVREFVLLVVADRLDCRLSGEDERVFYFISQILCLRLSAFCCPWVSIDSMRYFCFRFASSCSDVDFLVLRCMYFLNQQYHIKAKLPLLTESCCWLFILILIWIIIFNFQLDSHQFTQYFIKCNHFTPMHSPILIRQFCVFYKNGQNYHNLVSWFPHGHYKDINNKRLLISMPRENTQRLKAIIIQMAKRAKGFDDKKQYDVSSKLYKKILYLDPATSKSYQMYAQSLAKANKHLQAYQLLNMALLIQPNNLTLINLQIDTLFAVHKYQLLKSVIKKAQKIDSSNLNLCIKFAKACHGAKHFADGVQMIQKYEQKDKILVLRSQKILMWRSYLYYQLGNYALAQKYASDILKLSNVAEDDIYYYQIQNFKYLILLKNYKDVQIISNKLILDEKVELKTKLKTYALKAFYFSRVSMPQKALDSLQQALKANSNDEMTQCKWSLMTIMVLTNQNLHLLKSNMIKERLQFVLNKMILVSKQQFEDHRFSQHFNWYQQLSDFEKNIEFLLTYFDSIPQFINEFKKYALNMFLTLLQGYQNCVKINERLSQIETSIKMKICGNDDPNNDESKNQNSQQRKENQPQK